MVCHSYVPVPSSIAGATVVWCPVLLGNSQHSYAYSATDTFSIWIISGSPLGRVTSELIVGLVGMSQIGIAPTVPLADVAEARGRIVGAEIRSPDRPARNSVAITTELPGPI